MFLAQPPIGGFSLYKRISRASTVGNCHFFLHDCVLIVDFDADARNYNMLNKITIEWVLFHSLVNTH